MDVLLSLVQERFPLMPHADKPVTFEASGMDFSTVRYDADGLGSVSLMQAAGMGGKMSLTTLIVNPFLKDAPLLSIDRIQAMGMDMLYLELFDTTLNPGFDNRNLENIAAEAAALPNQDPGIHWYDGMRVGTPLIKKGTAEHSAAFQEVSERYLSAYLAACQAAPACDPALKRVKAAAYGEGLLQHGGPATDPVKASLGEERTAVFFRKTLFGTENEPWDSCADAGHRKDLMMTEQDKLDIEHFKHFWTEQQKTAKHMDREAALQHIESFIKAHNTCALATGIGDFIRCTPIEYTFMDGKFHLYSEGGDKFIGLEKNGNVSLAIFEYYGDRNNSHGLQVTGKAILHAPGSELFKQVLAFKGIPYDVMKAAQVQVALIEIHPTAYEMYDTDFVKAGFDVRQIVRF